jgi:hypothetical protein
MKEEGRRKKEEGRRKKEEGRRKREEGRRKREEGRGKKEEGRSRDTAVPCPYSLMHYIKAEKSDHFRYNRKGKREKSHQPKITNLIQRVKLCQNGK